MNFKKNAKIFFHILFDIFVLIPIMQINIKKYKFSLLNTLNIFSTKTKDYINILLLYIINFMLFLKFQKYFVI